MTMMQNITNDEQKAILKSAFKEAVGEWLDAKAAEFGKFSLKWIGGAVLAALLYLFMTAHGWKL